MQELQKINRASNITTYRAKNEQTVQSMIKRLKLESRFFAILVNGKLAKQDQLIQKEDKIVILPKIAGG